MYYAVQAQVATRDGKYTGSRQVPTFYLCSSVQGITSEAEAIRIARQVIDPLMTGLEMTVTVVAVPEPDEDDFSAYLDRFTEHYARAILDDATYEGDRQCSASEWQTPGDYWGQEAFTAEGVLTIQRECENFLKAQWNIIWIARKTNAYTPEQAGYDFLLTRCGAGVGFWDRGLGDAGDRLTEASKPYGEVHAEYYHCEAVVLQ